MDQTVRCVTCGAQVKLKQLETKQYVLACCGDIAIHVNISNGVHIFDKIQLHIEQK